VERNFASSPFSDVIKPNNGDNAANPGVLDPAFSTLNPRNALDLGASISNVGNALGAGDHFVATYKLKARVDNPGNYQVRTISEPGTGWVAGSPTFVESEFTAHATSDVTITPAPEPSFLCLLPLFLLGRKGRK
jgi:hypothetical protein